MSDGEVLETAGSAEKTVLVIDDEQIVRKTVCRILRKLGYTTLEAGDGYDAVQLFQEKAAEIQAVLLDVTMPSLSGEDTFREIRKIDPGAKVILMSGYSQMDLDPSFPVDDLAGFLGKPFSAENLADKVGSIF